MHKLLLAILLTACGSHPEPRSCSGQPEHVQLEQDPSGFVETHKCDSLIWSGLMSAAGYDVDMVAAEVGPGEWLRRPSNYKECYASNESFSTISRDQLLGVYWHAWIHKDRAMLERLWDYGSANAWRMGSGRLFGADTLMNPKMISTLAQMIHRLGGDNHKARLVPALWSVVHDQPKYYVNRLSALHIELRRRVYGHTSKNGQNALLEMHRTWPKNPLFAWAYGHACEARDLANLVTIPTGIHNDDEYIYERAFVQGVPNE